MERVAQNLVDSLLRFPEILLARIQMWGRLEQNHRARNKTLKSLHSHCFLRLLLLLLDDFVAVEKKEQQRQQAEGVLVVFEC